MLETRGSYDACDSGSHIGDSAAGISGRRTGAGDQTAAAAEDAGTETVRLPGLSGYAAHAGTRPKTAFGAGSGG